jgi:ribonucleoside-diphosphate reductase alpha chain
MQVRKRSGTLEDVELSKIELSLKRYCGDLPNIDVYRIASKTVGGLVDGVSTLELDLLSVRTAKDLIIDDPVYSKVAARILANVIQKEVAGLDIQSFSQSIELGFQEGLISEATHALVLANKRKLNAAIRHERDWNMEFHGLQTVYDRYVLKHPTLLRPDGGGKKQRAVIETPQYFFMRVACGLANDAVEVIEMYNLLSSLEYMCSTPTLFNSGTTHSQMSSCYLNDSPLDSLDSIYKSYSDIALLSKFAGGIGVSLSRIRGRDALIRGTNGKSNGLVPWAHTLSSSVSSVNQCLHPDTKVYTAQGMKPIKDIVADSDRVLGISGYYRPVEQVLRYDTANERMLEIKIRHGGASPLRVTDGHPIYAIQGSPTGELSFTDIEARLAKGVLRSAFTEAGNLHVGDFVATPIPQQIIDVAEFSDDDAYFYGMMLGNGHISRKMNHSHLAECGLTFNSSTGVEQMEFSRAYLGARGIHYWEYTETNRPNCSYIRWTYSPKMCFSIADIYDADEDFKIVAPRFMHLPHTKTLRMLEGLIDTDGNVSRGTELTFTNVSVALVEGLRYQLVRLSVMSGIQVRRRVGDRIIVRADGSEDRIAFDNDYTDVRIPAATRLATVLGIPVVTKNHWLVYGGMLWSRIKTIKEIATPTEVYDLRVEFDETYTVAGALVHNGGKRKGAAAIYLEPHHPDIMQFLELKDNSGEREQRAYNLNLASWVSDLFMKRVKEDGIWSLFDPTVAPELVDLYGDAYEKRYMELEADKKYTEQLPARKVYARMMRTLAETGNAWMTFKDTCNKRGNQVNDEAGTMIHLSNLCTEILEVTSSGKCVSLSRNEMEHLSSSDLIEKSINIVGFDTKTDTFKAIEGAEISVCNLGSINLARGYIKHGKLDKEKLRRNVAIGMKYLDRVINRNFYPVPESEASNMRWRPVGLGLMGLADFFMQLRIPFDSEQAIKLSGEIQEEIYYQALKTSCELAKELGPHRDFNLTRAAKGDLQFDLAGVVPDDIARWDNLKTEIKEHGLRNSLTIAIAPTATISHICGVEEAIEPIKSNLLKRETLSGEFISVNKYLVDDLRKLGKWNAETTAQLKIDEGSIANIAGLPPELYANYKTVWEMSMKSLIAHAVARGAYIDQSHSLNMFIDLNKYPEDKRIGVLSSLYMHAWESGLKTTYYFRSRAATRIQQTTVRAVPVAVAMAPEDADVCESCT